jgi:hypothetical protein
MLDEKFPDRKEIKYTYQKSLIESIKSIDLTDYDYNKANDEEFAPRTKITQKQKIYFWIRLYLNEETEIEPNDIVNIVYTPLNEVLETTFVCYSKPYSSKVDVDNLTEYNPEDDKKVLCLMVDQSRINENSDDIPFIRSLFKISKYYEDRVMRKGELKFILEKNDTDLEYFSIGF